MPPAVIHLHIGSPKTGTTFLQDSLWQNREALAAAGVLLPGRSRTIVGTVVGDLLKWKASDGELPAGWRRLCAEVNRWEGHSVVLSHEHLHKADRAQWQALVDSLDCPRVQVVLTARDLARSVPAQWQSSVRQRYTWTLGEYADDIAATAPGTQVSGPARHFWRRQDTPAILHRFAGRIPVDRVRLVTVPPSGGDPDELWRRFCRACEIDVTATRPAEVAHESLGAASAELMRRLNASAPVAGLSVADYKKTVNHALSRHALSPRRGEEPGLTLPDEHLAWADREARRLVRRIEKTGVEVVGDLADLVPRPPSKPFVRPEALPEADLLEAALAGLGGMAQHHVELRRLLDEARRTAREERATPSPTATPGAAASVGGPLPKAVESVLRRFGRGS